MDKAVTFAKHLQNVFTPNQHNTESNKIILNTDVNQNTPPIKFKWKDVKNMIKTSINPKKASGYDKITGKMIVEFPDNIIKLLTCIFNCSMKIGYYPKAWKISQIIMIPKPGKDDTKPASYRPISLLPSVSKLFEKMLMKELEPVLQDIIPSHQFGFRQHHGTVEQIHRIVSKIKSTMENKQYSCAVFLDIAQAFDRVWHDGLFHKICTVLPSKFHALLKSYIINRKFQVKINSDTTDLFPIEAGVPQGSVLGPVLYLFYTYDLPTDTNNIMISTFADDTAIIASHSNPDTASRILQDHLDKVKIWVQKWRIKVNESKCAHITFTLRRHTCPPVKFNDVNLPQQEEVKYLGLTLDRRLTWKSHILNKCTQIKLKFNKMYWMVGRNSKLSLDNKLLLYKSIIMPIWKYGIQLWGSASASNIDRIQRLQSKILRNIVNAPYYVRNINIHRDLQMKLVNDVIKENSANYINKLRSHPNELVKEILNTPKFQRLNRIDPLDLA